MTAHLPYEIPEDFDAFWEEVVAEAAAVPLDFRRETADHPACVPTHRLERLRFLASQNRILEGWIAAPPGARDLPGFVWLAPYGRESVLPNVYGTREGMVSMSFNYHGEDAFHQEKYVPARGYFAEGIESPRTWIFRRLILDVLVALRVFRAQSEVDATQIAVAGMSQGAGLAIWAGGLSSIPRCVCADMPFLGRMDRTLTQNAYRYPLKEIVDWMEARPLGREQALLTLSYFDTTHRATRCHLPTLVSLGEKDPAVRPETARAIYEALPGEKRLMEYPGGHDWTPEMIEANRDWMLSYVSVPTKKPASH